MTLKMMQEFGDEGLVPSAEIPIKRMEKLPLPYSGNKKKLASAIHDTIVKHNLKFDSILDAFTGSASVAFLFKLMGKRVLANDLLTSSYVNAAAFVENDQVKLSDEEKHFLLHNQNSNKSTFVRDNYLGTQFRPDGKPGRFNKFTPTECDHLDNFRANIDELCSRYTQSVGLAANAAVILRLPFGNMDASADMMVHRLRQDKNYGIDSGKHDRRIGIYYDAQMNLNFNKWFSKYVDDFTTGMKYSSPPSGTDIKIKRAAFLANLQQHVLRDCMVQGRLHCGQSLAELDVRLNHPKNQLKHTWDRQHTEMDFFTQSGLPGQGFKWWTFANISLPGSCLASNMDATLLLNSGFCKVDAVYFDPPYGGQSSDYATMYRFLEEYIYSAPLEDLSHIKQYGNKFVGKRNYEKHFCEMLDAAKDIGLWLFSYNDSSWQSIEYITDLIKKFNRKVVVEVLSDQYRYLYRKKQGRETKSSEYLIIART